MIAPTVGVVSTVAGAGASLASLINIMDVPKATEWTLFITVCCIVLVFYIMRYEPPDQDGESEE